MAMDGNGNLRLLAAAAIGAGVAVIVLGGFLVAGRLLDGRTETVDDDGAAAVLDATGTTLGSTAATATPASPTTTALDGDRPGTADYEAIRNRQEKFTRFAEVPSLELDVDALMEPAPVNDNGTVGDGQFRAACEYSHFGQDDPIIYPGQPGASHLHMFFGNTEVDAFTTEDELINSGGGTCSGFELNRSGYWTPALLDGKGNVVVPDQIILYYKTKHPESVTAMPQGLQMLAGNTDSESFESSDILTWSCGPNGHAYNETNRIPDCGGDVINASIVFPNCWDGVNKTSPDFKSHLTYVNDNEECPASHPRRLPKISILLYYPGTDSVEGWRLSSDETGTFNGPPGGTLHADWWGGWNDETMDLWIEGCMQAARNCSYGQTGTPRQLMGLNQTESYEGENFLPLPGS
jgi:hypothetical protein